VRVVALVDDLMDRSRLSAAVPDVTYTRDPNGVGDADVVVVDLARYPSAVATVRTAAPAARVVAFGPHVDGAALDQARAEGADVVVPRSAFFRNPAGVVIGGGADRQPQ